jgi:hypothetical protein
MLPMAGTWAAVMLLLLVPLAGGCSTAHHQASRAGPGLPPGSGTSRGSLQALASAYLAIAEPANGDRAALAG